MKKQIILFFLIGLFTQNILAGNYKLISVSPEKIVADRKRGVAYFNEEQRKNYLLAVDKKGKFFYPHRKAGENEVESFGKFIMSGNGDIYFASLNEMAAYSKSKTKKILINHGSFLAGAPVAMAGYLTFDEKGKMTEVLNDSGHYLPPKEYIKQFTQEIKKKGVKYKVKERSFVDIQKKIEERATGRGERSKCTIL